MRLRELWLGWLAILAWATLAGAQAGSATLVVATRPDGAAVVVDGTERGRTPATLTIDMPENRARQVRVELRLAGYETRYAVVRIGPGETLVWTNITLAKEGEPVTPQPQPQPQPQPPVADSGALPSNWPDYLKGLKLPAGLRLRVAAKDDMPQVWVPAGELAMGSSAEQIEEAVRLSRVAGKVDEAWLKAEAPVHQVKLKGYWMDLHEVTATQYCRFLNETNPTLANRRKWVNLAGERRDIPFVPSITMDGARFAPVKNMELYPVSFVSWHGAAAYAKWAGRSLPTEAQWERAARGGQAGKLFAWDGDTPPAGSGNLCDASHVQRFAQVKRPGRWFVGYDDGYDQLAPVCSFRPNALGVFDLIGNVTEWCRDGYAADYYQRSPASDPANEQDSSSGRVVRGGSFLTAPWATRPGCRLYAAAETCGVDFGFRCVADE